MKLPGDWNRKTEVHVQSVVLVSNLSLRVNSTIKLRIRAYMEQSGKIVGSVPSFDLRAPACVSDSLQDKPID
jgi:hypothetical protein